MHVRNVELRLFEKLSLGAHLFTYNTQYQLLSWSNYADDKKRDEEPISTCWIRPELIFDAGSIVKQEKLGCGEFGVVVKGLYKHGNAV